MIKQEDLGLRFHHIGIVVKDVQKSGEYFSSILPIVETSGIINDPNIDVRIRFLTDSSGVCYEVISPLSEQSPICSALKNKKNILNHIAYEVDDIEKGVDFFRDKGMIQLGEVQKAVAFNGRKVCFFMTAESVIIELIQASN